MNRLVAIVASAGLMGAGATAQADDRLVDGFDRGSTLVKATQHGFGYTAAPGINADGGNGDQARYFSWATAAGDAVSFDNVSTLGILQMRHAGGDAASYMNLSYGFSVPTDLSSFVGLVAAGSGAGQGEARLALQDSSGGVLLATFAMAGALDRFVVSLDTLQCLAGTGQRCGLDAVTGLEFRVSGFNGTAFAYDLDAIWLSGPSPASPAPALPIPEPGTWPTTLLGLLAVVAAVSSRRRVG